MAPAPGLPRTWDDLYAFPAEFEAFWDDAFGLRKQLLNTEIAVDATLFGQASTSKVIQGSSGWLFYAGDHSVELYRRALPLGSGDLSVLASERLRRATRLAELGVAYLMVIAPDKHTIHPEFMPTFLRRRTGASQLDQVSDTLQAAGVPFLDLRKPLLDAQAIGETYYRLDTHWNLFGAYVAHASIMNALGRGAIPLPIFIAGKKEGDLAVMANLPAIENAPELPPDEVGACTPQLELPLNGDDAKRYTCKDGSGRLLIYADSFGENLIPWLSRSFAETILAGPNPLWNKQLADVEREHPDVVIDLRVERKIVDLISASIMSVD